MQYFYFNSLRQKAVQHSWLTMHSWLYWISAWWIIPWKCKVCHSMLSYLQNQFLVLHWRCLMAYFSGVLHKNAPGHDIFQKLWCNFSIWALFGRFTRLFDKYVIWKTPWGVCFCTAAGCKDIYFDRGNLL